MAQADNINHLTDDELIQQYQKSRDQRLVGVLYQRHSHLIFGACLNYLHDRGESKDAVMSIFEKMLVKLPTAKIQSFNSWLFALTKNECLTRLRRRESAQNLKENYKYFEKSGEKVMEFEGVPRLSTDEEVPDPKEKLEIALNKLSPEQKKCIQLFFYEEKSYDQIATITGFSANQVKSHLQNGKRRLKRFLEMESS